MEVNKLIITFTGNKAQLHTQLKKWSEENGKSMNGLVIDLISKHLKKNEK